MLPPGLAQSVAQNQESESKQVFVCVQAGQMATLARQNYACGPCQRPLFAGITLRCCALRGHRLV
jgi:hypothetical protein